MLAGKVIEDLGAMLYEDYQHGNEKLPSTGTAPSSTKTTARDVRQHSPGDDARPILSRESIN